MILQNRNEISKRSDSYNKSLALLGRYDPLSKEEEIELFIKYKAGDQSAAEKLVLHNLRFAILASKTYHNTGIPIQDLIAEAYTGLIMAIDKFDHTMGNRFTSYAVHWVRRYMLDHVYDHSNNIRIPHNITNKISKLNRAQNLRLTAGEMPDPDIELLLRKFKPVTHNSLDDVYEDGSPMESRIPGHYQEYKEDNEILVKHINNLKEPYKTVLIHSFGMYGNTQLDLQQIGDNIGRSRERVRQIKEKALWMLRNKLRKYQSTGEFNF